MKVSLIYLKGGLGNQLFQFAYANFLKSKKHKIIFNAETYKNPELFNITKRELIFPIQHFGFTYSSSFMIQFFSLLNKIFQSRTLKKFFVPKKNKIFNYIKDKDIEEFKQNSLFTIYDGYWQDYEYVNHSKKFLISSLSKNKLIFDAFQSPKVSGSTLIHIRRQDYLKLNQELDVEYYKRAIKKASDLIKDFDFTVFTDDFDWVNSHDIFNDAINIYSPKSVETKKDILKTFSKMLRYENFIIANSSFSYMAAFLGSTTNSKVIYPDPWFKGRRKEISFDDKWININQ